MRPRFEQPACGYRAIPLSVIVSAIPEFIRGMPDDIPEGGYPMHTLAFIAGALSNALGGASWRRSLVNYGGAICMIAATLAITMLLRGYGTKIPPLLLFIVAVAIATRYFGNRAGLLAVLASVLTVDFFFIQPIYSLMLEREALPRLLVFLAGAYLVSLFTMPIRQRREALEPLGLAAAGTIAGRQAATARPVDVTKVSPHAVSDAELQAFQTKKILIMGLPGSGKTSLANVLVARLNAVHLNGDDVRANIHKDLGFSAEHRIEHAQRMGWLCDQVVSTGAYAIADFICPTAATRAAFGNAFVIWVDRIEKGRFADTNELFETPSKYDVRVTAEGSPNYWTEKICSLLTPNFNPKAPTAFFLGRYQPFHAGHKALIEEGLQRVGQVCIAVRDTHGIDDKNPLDFHAVKGRIESALWQYRGRITVLHVPNITNVFYGRDVGYSVEQLILDKQVEQISASQIRSELTDRDWEQK